MKRRLSCAISLIGSPDTTFLDEPSTGLDPASRRGLWNVISAAKGNKSIVLTTHSMEEADILCDRIAIMAKGKLQCVGTAAALKRRFGRGYTLTMTAKDESLEIEKRMHSFVYGMFPTAKLLQEPIGGTSKFEISRDEVVLSKVFSTMNDPKTRRDVGFVDWGFTETTLEEVFLKLAKLSAIPAKLKRSLSDLARDVDFMKAIDAREEKGNDSDVLGRFKSDSSASMGEVITRVITPPATKARVHPMEIADSKAE